MTNQTTHSTRSEIPHLDINQTVRFLQDMIRIPSLSNSPEELQAAARMVQEMQSLGFDEAWQDEKGNAILQPGFVRTRYTYPYNFSRNPTLSLPCGFDSEGLPISLQLVGKLFDEAGLCRVGHAYEQATKWHTEIAEKMAARF